MIKTTDRGIWINPTLKSNLDTLIMNQKNDFDFVILISGSGSTRTGKTIWSINHGYYMFYQLKQYYKFKTLFTVENNICFSSTDLIKKALASKHPNVFIYDEAREGLDVKKLWYYTTRTLLDFFAECGILNHIYLIVLPDYFELPKGMAITRSVALVDVFYLYKRKVVTKTIGDIKKGTEYLKFERGYYHFYNRDSKKRLYNYGKKEQDYSRGKPNFKGEFIDRWVIDKDEYMKKKNDFLKRNRGEIYSGGKFKTQRDYLIYHLVKKLKENPNNISKLISKSGEPITRRGVSFIVARIEKK